MIKNFNIDTLSRSGCDKSIVNVWSKWAVQHLSTMRLFYHAGLLPRGNKKYRTYSNRSADWSNIVEHSLVVNGLACFIATILNVNGKHIDTGIVSHASLLHDIDKRMQRELGITYANEHNFTLKQDFLREHSINEHIINAASYTGRVADIYIIDKSERIKAISERPIEWLVVAYADARVRNTDVVLIEKAFIENCIKNSKDTSFYLEWLNFYREVEHFLFDGLFISPMDITPKSIQCYISGVLYKHQSEKKKLSQLA